MEIIKLLFLTCFLMLAHAGESQQVDTLEGYFGLKTYFGPDDTVYVNHERYYGYFAKDSSCTVENHGTTFLTNNGCYRRIHNNFSPRFWALGGDSPDIAIGTVVEEVDAINCAAIAAYRMGGDTLEIDSLYKIDRSVFLLKNVTYFGTCDSCGFVRVDPPVTVLTDTAKVLDNKIKVENNIGFRTRQNINIASAINYDSLAGFVSYTASIAPFIGGDSTIFLSGLKIQKQMLPGDSVGLFFPMMVSLYNDLDSIRLENLVFNGNRNKYTLNYDWRTSPTMLIPTTNLTIIEKCRFYDIPVENVIFCGGIVRECSGAGFNGSSLHFSCNDFDNPTEILYNDFSAINEVGDSIMEHSEAAFTFSAKVENFRIAYNNLSDINENGIGIFKNDDSFNEITDNLLDTELPLIDFQPFYLYTETNLIYNNKNLNTADLSEGNCWVQEPNIKEPFICSGGSSFNAPLKVGDTITIALDSLVWINSNENYVKRIIPIYQANYFTLHNATLNTDLLSEHHQWVYEDTSALENAIVFDNGHENGLYEKGNWGYELCNQLGNCTDLSFTFIVHQLPDTTQQVACPLTGLSIVYDGEVGTWDQPIYCQNEPIYFDTELLGQPVLEGGDTAVIIKASTPEEYLFSIFPNPTSGFIFIKMENKNKINFNYKIFNLQGQQVQVGNNISDKIKIEQLQNGGYFIKIIAEDKTTELFFIKN